MRAVKPGPEKHRDDELLESKREILRLKGDLHRVKEEQDILKKAAAYFARNPE